MTPYLAAEFARYGILAPPRCILPRAYVIGRSGVPVAPTPRGRIRVEEIRRRREAMPEWKRALPRYAPLSDYWPRKFHREWAAAVDMTDLELLLTPADERAAQAREQFWAGRGSPGALYDAVDAARHAAFLRDANAAGIIDVDSGSNSGEEDEEDDAGG